MRQKTSLEVIKELNEFVCSDWGWLRSVKTYHMSAHYQSDLSHLFWGWTLFPISLRKQRETFSAALFVHEELVCWRLNVILQPLQCLRSLLKEHGVLWIFNEESYCVIGKRGILDVFPIEVIMVSRYQGVMGSHNKKMKIWSQMSSPFLRFSLL